MASSDRRNEVRLGSSTEHRETTVVMRIATAIGFPPVSLPTEASAGCRHRRTPTPLPPPTRAGRPWRRPADMMLQAASSAFRGTHGWHASPCVSARTHPIMDGRRQPQPSSRDRGRTPCLRHHHRTDRGNTAASGSLVRPRLSRQDRLGRHRCSRDRHRRRCLVSPSVLPESVKGCPPPQ